MLEREPYLSYSKSRRDGLIMWALQNSTHILDLAPNRHENLTKLGLEKLFSQLCLKTDRRLLRTRDVHLRSSHERLRIIAFPEKLDVNPHIHAFADFSPWRPLLQEVQLRDLLAHTWYEVTQGSGTLRICDNFDRGAAVYRTKEAPRRDYDYLHSWDFHPERKLQAPPSAIGLQRRKAVRKPRTH